MALPLCPARIASPKTLLRNEMSSHVGSLCRTIDGGRAASAERGEHEVVGKPVRGRARGFEKPDGANPIDRLTGIDCQEVRHGGPGLR